MPQSQPEKPAYGQGVTHQGKRRLVRITCDVFLPEHYDGAKIEDIHVHSVRVEGYCDEMLYDLIQVTVQEARVELDLDRC